ncbi:MAG TPA: 30S ribosomal protein S16 [Fodinibius sp.]|nr:30S ribosomal protein S16 [Fodinibius sp.]
MLRIRLQRRGRKKRPIHHIVVADSRKPRDGRIVEDLGRFDNVTVKNQLELNRKRALYWLKQGAKPTDTIRSIFKNQGIMYEMHLIRWGKSDEEIEAALTEWREKRAEKEEQAPTRKERQQALLEAEEKEFQKQLKKKAEEAAREKAKQEALAAEEEEQEEEDAADEQEAEAAPEEETGEETESQPQETEAQADAEEEEQDEEEKTSGEPKISANMLAKDAITHIEQTPAEELEGFVTEAEDRVTVRRAWEDKLNGGGEEE